jgi:hypothetical protein
LVKVRRKSNDGTRKRDIEDRALLLLIRLRRGIPFEGLRIMLDVAQFTAVAYYHEMLNIFCEAPSASSISGSKSMR